MQPVNALAPSPARARAHSRLDTTPLPADLPRPMLLRDPADVPAPVAIALADFCRRAGRPSSADEVRQALARLSPDEDRAVQQLCAGEPAARPLSPHAVIDVVRGLPAAEAARREEAGVYGAIAAEAAAEAAARPAAPGGLAAEVAAAAREQGENPFAPGDESQRARIRAAVARAAGDLERAADELGLEDGAALRRLAAKLGVLDELLGVQAAAPAAKEKPQRRKKTPALTGPIRRTRAEVEAMRAAKEKEEEPAEEAPPAPRPGRSPAAPQFGRYVTGQAVRRPWAELESPEGSAVLEGLVAELRANRRQIVDRLGVLYARPDGKPIGEADLDRLLARHDLTDWLRSVERENLRILLRQSRGFLPPVRRALQLEPRELQKLLRLHNLEADVRELKERTREEARADRPLAERLVLAAEKAEQLEDAGVLAELDERNLAELRPAIEAVAAEGTSTEPTVVVELARRRLAIEPRAWRKALRRYRLAWLAAEILGVPPPEEPRASRTTGEVEREVPPRSSLPQKPRFGAPRREVLVTRIGAEGERPRRFGAGAAIGGERPPRRFGTSAATGGERTPRRFGAGAASGGERPPRRVGAGAASGGERPPRRFGAGAPSGGERPPRRFGAGAVSGGERPPRRSGAGAAPGGERPPRRFGPDHAPGGARPPRRPDAAGRPARREGGDRPARPGAGGRPSGRGPRGGKKES